MTNQTDSTQPLGTRAVVLGGSIGGLLAARVLAERFSEVVVLENDQLGVTPAPRKGTPHALHAHGLLARGREVIEELFPGFTEGLVARGAKLADLQLAVPLYVGTTRLAAAPSGIPALAASRPLIEAELRARVRVLPNVVVRGGCEARDLVVTDGRITGVCLRDENVTDRVLGADLVVDATGRGSRCPAWLEALGYRRPKVDSVDVQLVYASASFRRDPDDSLAAVVCGATPQLPRPGAAVAAEPLAQDVAKGAPRWSVSVVGYAGDAPEASIEGVQSRAREMASPELVRITQGEPIGAVSRYGFPASLRRRYERLRRLPEGLVVLGDALASFNPSYGQGMTVAACEALALRDELASGLAGLTRRYFRAAARIVDSAWLTSVLGDLAITAVPSRQPVSVRLLNAYLARLQGVASIDAELALAFLRVVHFLAAPASLLRPKWLWRTLFSSRSRAGKPVRTPAPGLGAAATAHSRPSRSHFGSKSNPSLEVVRSA